MERLNGARGTSEEREWSEGAGTKRLEDSERAQIHRLFYCPSLDSMYLFHSIFISKASYSSIPFSSLKALLISYSSSNSHSSFPFVIIHISWSPSLQRTTKGRGNDQRERERPKGEALKVRLSPMKIILSQKHQELKGKVE